MARAVLYTLVRLSVGVERLTDREFDFCLHGLRLRMEPRAAIEVAFIMFLFYSNLLMGEFERASGMGKSFGAALTNIFTVTNFAVGLSASFVGYAVVEFLRGKF